MAVMPFFGPHARLFVVVTALLMMALEYGFARLARLDTHDARESAASLGVAAGQNLIRLLEAVFVAVPMGWIYQHRLFNFDQRGILALLGLFVATEFLYYWQHRTAHNVRWLWATHSVHHSATKLNFTAAIRLGWTGNLSGHFLFFVPLVWLGFNPVAVVAMLGVNLFYQFFIHTELAPRFGPLEWLFNTPTHHRVHHAVNATCLDRNFGGVLIIFDRLFGSFAEVPAGEALRYGLVSGERSLNPVKIALGEWQAMLGDLRQGRWDALIAMPGKPDEVEKR